jgi:hypothetical protein
MVGKTYRHPKDYPIPELDLLTVLFGEFLARLLCTPPRAI